MGNQTGYDYTQEFEFGLDLILAGINRLRPDNARTVAAASATADDRAG